MNELFYDGWYWTYGSFALMVLTRETNDQKQMLPMLVYQPIVATFIHWLGTSPALSVDKGSMYPRTFNGWITSLIAAIPYEWNMLVVQHILWRFVWGI